MPRPALHPDFLVVGHFTRDVTPKGKASHIGGTAAYSALTAKNLGYNAAALTSYGPDLEIPSSLDDIPVCRVPSSETTVFSSVYSGRGRCQRIHSVASRIEARDLPAAWRLTPLVHVGPVANEVDPELVRIFEQALVCVTPQGWMRQWNKDGRVRLTEWKGAQVIIPFVDIMVVSQQETKGLTELDEWAERLEIIVVTEGERGARVHTRDGWSKLPPIPVVAVDSTGAGDVFATAFTVRYWETKDPYQAALFGSCAAGISVEGVGTAKVPTREEIEQRLSNLSR